MRKRTSKCQREGHVWKWILQVGKIPIFPPITIFHKTYHLQEKVTVVLYHRSVLGLCYNYLKWGFWPDHFHKISRVRLNKQIAGLFCSRSKNLIAHCFCTISTLTVSALSKSLHSRSTTVTGNEWFAYGIHIFFGIKQKRTVFLGQTKYVNCFIQLVLTSIAWSWGCNFSDTYLPKEILKSEKIHFVLQKKVPIILQFKSGCPSLIP